jgi:hypothetical protein
MIIIYKREIHIKSYFKQWTGTKLVKYLSNLKEGYEIKING